MREQEVKLYHVKTQADYDALMQELEEQGCEWATGHKPTDRNFFYRFVEYTIVKSKECTLWVDHLQQYNSNEIIEYTAKEKGMRKDKEWLVKEIENHLKETEGENAIGSFDNGYEQAMDYALCLIDQLEEPEVTHNQAYDLLKESSTLSEKSFDFYWNSIADGVEVDEWVTEERAWEVIAKERSLSAEEAQEVFNGNYRKMLFEELEQESEIVKKWQDVAEKLKEEVIALREREPEITEERAWNKIAEYYPENIVSLKNGFEHWYYNQDKQPEKVTIPQFVADWIQKHQFHDLPISMAIDFEEQKNPEVWGWLHCGDAYVMNQESFARAWLDGDGYEIEKEKLYYAKIKGHELIDTDLEVPEGGKKGDEQWYRNIHWVLQNNGDLIVDMKDSGLAGAKHKMTIEQWSELGVNDSNAEFEEDAE